MKYVSNKKMIVIGIFFLFFGTSIVSGISEFNEKTKNEKQLLEPNQDMIRNTVVVGDNGKYNHPWEISRLPLPLGGWNHDYYISPDTFTIETEYIPGDSSSEYYVSIEYAQKLMASRNVVLLDVQDEEISNYIDGAIPVTMTDLECGDCLKSTFNNYDGLIVSSKNSALREKASNILRKDGFTVYSLSEIPHLNDFSSIYEASELRFVNNKISSLDEGHSLIQLSETNARVGAYTRGGRIKRLYGEAFSHGGSPLESAEAFLQVNADLFHMEPVDLRIQNIQPIMYDRDTDLYKFTGINYVQYKNDIPVFHTRLILLIRNEEGFPLVLVSADLRDLGDFNVNIEQLFLDSTKGISKALDDSPNLVDFSQPELVIWAGVDDVIVRPVLAYSFIGSNNHPTDGDNPERYQFVTEVETGMILYKESLILFEDVIGNVQGMATQGKAADFCEEELPEAMPWARVNIGVNIAYTDENGDFVIFNSGSSQVIVESRLRGLWFRVFNQAGSDAVLYESVIPPGPANFMHNELNINEYNRAEVNGYLQANIVRDFTLTYNPSYPGLQDSEFPVYVNDDTGYCPGNAWYDGSSITFCRAGSGYPNTAWSTVIHHEYGHHLVQMAGSGQGAYGEGMGDVMGLLITDDPGTGWGFFGNCNQPLRTADNTLQYPCSGEIHYCGQLISGSVWSTRNELVITNPSTYLDILSNLAINAMLLHTGDSIDPSITVDYLTLDDDNGNILDGTPHYNEIAAGFGAHNMDAPEIALLSFDFPYGLPEMISPSGGTTVRVIVSSVTADPEPGTGVLHINDGSGWIDIPMTEIVPNEYDAVFPATNCGDLVSFYFSAETTGGQEQRWPVGAPAELFSTVSAANIAIEFSDDFNSDLGWTVENSPSLSDGAWERGIPVGGGDRGDPSTDYDGSGYCYLTDNVDGNSDVDDGYTWLISPTFDLSTGADAKIDYALWYTNYYGADPNNDLFKVYVSDNNGLSWILVETVGPVTTSGWKEYTFMVADFVTPNSQVKVRFEASDLSAGSVVEAGIDDFRVSLIECIEPQISRADFDGDGDVDLDDYANFAQCYAGAGRPPAPSCPGDMFDGGFCKADFDQDNDVDLNDYAKFAQCYGGAGNPPSDACSPDMFE